MRQAEVAASLLRRGARVLLRTEAPTWLFPAGVQPIGTSAATRLDVGVAQHDSLEIDVEETLRRCASFYGSFDQRVDQEVAILRQAGVEVVLGDVPPLAFVAARRAGVPGIAVANFGWDWIYEAWNDRRFGPYIERIRKAYGEADLLLRLPFSPAETEGFPAFRHVEPVPLITRQATRTRKEVRREIGVSDDATLVLLSFGGFDAQGLDLQALDRWSRYCFVMTPLKGDGTPVPSNVLVLPRSQLDYLSLLAACEAVVTKPGYGIVVDALVARVPVLYTDRGAFREYPFLVQALETLGRARHVPRAQVRAGDLGPHLDALLAVSTPWGEIRGDGAQVIADRVIERATGTLSEPRASLL